MFGDVSVLAGVRRPSCPFVLLVLFLSVGSVVIYRWEWRFAQALLVLRPDGEAGRVEEIFLRLGWQALEVEPLLEGDRPGLSFGDAMRATRESFDFRPLAAKKFDEPLDLCLLGFADPLPRDQIDEPVNGSVNFAPGHCAGPMT